MEVDAVTIVLATRNRRENALATLRRLAELPERPPVILVDDASDDGTAAAARASGLCEVVALGRPHGAAARTVGVRRATTPLVAICDDDSWWAPGSLARAARCFAGRPQLGLVAARVLVGESHRLDPTCKAMARGLLGSDGLPGPEVLGFLACGAVVRRDVYLAVGGFHPRYGVGGEEQPFALALRAAGFRAAYVEDVVAHHHPSPQRDVGRRRRRQLRNDVWTAWLWRAPERAAAASAALAWRARCDPAARGALLDALRGLPWVVRERRPVPPAVERAVRVLEQAGS